MSKKLKKLKLDFVIFLAGMSLLTTHAQDTSKFSDTEVSVTDSNQVLVSLSAGQPL